MKISIKNMVCNRCISAVADTFANAGIATENIQLGEVETVSELSEDELKMLAENLESAGFEILENQSQKLIEKAKNAIIQKIAGLDIDEDFLLSEFLSETLHREYSSVSKTFSQNHGITLEQYFILQKIEKVKELLIYNESTLSEIAVMLGYKSVQHLSSQFKNTTGFTPSQFKKLKVNKRKPLDSIE